MHIFRFFIFPIPFFQNACNGCENTENWTWYKFLWADESFWGSVQTWLTQREVVFIFQRAKISDLVYRDLHCAMAFRVKSTNRSNRIKIESASVRGSNKDGRDVFSRFFNIAKIEWIETLGPMTHVYSDFNWPGPVWWHTNQSLHSTL